MKYQGLKRAETTLSSSVITQNATLGQHKKHILARTRLQLSTACDYWDQAPSVWRLHDILFIPRQSHCNVSAEHAKSLQTSCCQPGVTPASVFYLICHVHATRLVRAMHLSCCRQFLQVSARMEDQANISAIER